MITRVHVLNKWAGEWVRLRAWQRDLSEVEIEISDREHTCRLGTCWSHEQRLVVYRGSSMAIELDTLLHELAHAATIGDHHGPTWQHTYASAIAEVTKIRIPHAADNYRVLCEAGRDAMRSWWVSSGNDMLWRLLCRM